MTLTHLASLASLFGSGKAGPALRRLGQLFGAGVHRWRNDRGIIRTSAGPMSLRLLPSPDTGRSTGGTDFGFSKPFSVGGTRRMRRAGFLPHQGAVRCTGRPNEGLRMIGGTGKADPRGRAERPDAQGPHHSGVADPAIFDESRGESIAAMMERGPHFSPLGPR